MPNDAANRILLEYFGTQELINKAVSDYPGSYNDFLASVNLILAEEIKNTLELYKPVIKAAIQWSEGYIKENGACYRPYPLALKLNKAVKNLPDDIIDLYMKKELQ